MTEFRRFPVGAGAFAKKELFTFLYQIAMKFLIPSLIEG